MDFILTDKDGYEQKVLIADMDIDLNDTRDFAITFLRQDYKNDMNFGCRVFAPDTEYGGIIIGIETHTSENEIIIYGMTWRGMLDKHIVKPPAGEDYLILSGELNALTGQLLSDAGLSDLFSSLTISSGKKVKNVQIPRYITLLATLERLYDSAGCIISLRYIEGNHGETGHILTAPIPKIDYSGSVELSQDYDFDFTMKQMKGVNHLVCLGRGELKDRVAFDWYVNQNGKISTKQSFFGQNEIAEVFDYPNAESLADLKEKGKARLGELMSETSMEMEVNSIDVDLPIGAIVGGRDYLTGVTMSKPITNKIYRRIDGVESIEYSIEESEK